MKSSDVLWVGVGLLVIAVVARSLEKSAQLNRVVITERDIVRYCMDRRAAHAPEKDIEFYCRDLGGDYYRAQGITPNYEQYDSRKLFPATGAK